MDGQVGPLGADLSAADPGHDGGDPVRLDRSMSPPSIPGMETWMPSWASMIP